MSPVPFKCRVCGRAPESAEEFLSWTIDVPTPAELAASPSMPSEEKGVPLELCPDCKRASEER